MATVNRFLLGNSLRFEANCRDWDNIELLNDPTLIKLSILDIQMKVIETFTLGPQNRLGLGKYFYIYIPQKTGTFYTEWYAEIDGLPSLDRQEFTMVNKL